MDTRRDEGQYYMYGKRVMPPSPTDGDVRHAEFEGIDELPEKFTDEDVRRKMNTLIGTLKGTTAALAVAFALPLLGAGVTVETARKGEIYNDEPVVVGVAFKQAIAADELRALCDDVVATAATNRPLAQWSLIEANGRGPGIVDVFDKSGAAPALRAEYDAKFADVGLDVSWEHYGLFPRCGENWFAAKPGLLENHPALVAVARRNGSTRWFDYSVPEIINVCCDISARGDMWSVEYLKKTALEHAPKAIRRRFRVQGKSFLSKEGEENPVQKPLDELSAALNAPKMAGVAAWVKEWCPDYTWIEPRWMADEEIKKLMDEIYYGDREFDVWCRNILQSHLGVEEYNKFVEKYNGTIEE